MSIELRDLEAVPRHYILELLNDSRARKHLVRHDQHTETTCEAFVRAKRQHRDRHGFGVSAIYCDGEFVGWGGPQRWGDSDVELALVISPRHWGLGPRLFRILADDLLANLGADSFVVLLRHSRPESRVLPKVGFVYEGDNSFEGEDFRRYRMKRSAWVSARKSIASRAGDPGRQNMVGTDI